LRPTGGWPRISIVTPSYNQGEFIEETIRSILLQGYPDLEYVIVDGGSDDESVELIKKYEPWLTHWVSHSDRGQSHALNKGFDKCSGAVLGWLNSDDVLNESALQIVGAHFAQLPESMVFAGRSEIKCSDGSKTLWSVDALPTTFDELCNYAKGKFLPQPSVFFRRTAFDEVGGISEDFHYAMDLDLWLKIATKHPIDTTAHLLSWIRWHTDAKTNRNTLAVLKEVETILAPNSASIPASVRKSLYRALRRNQSEAWSREGLRAYFVGNRTAAWQAAFNALASASASCTHRVWLSLILRLILPKAITSTFLKRP
jgi:glycosyltransferase involved in cell wall biosynthesis